MRCVNALQFLLWTTIDAAFTNPANSYKGFIFKGNQYVRYDYATDMVESGYPKNFNSAYWLGVPWTSIDSAVTTANNICYIFKGNEYIKYDLNLDKAIQGINPINGAYWPGLTITNNIKGSLTVGKNTSITPQQKLVNVARSYVNRPDLIKYSYGTNGPLYYDCSAFTKKVFKDALNIDLDRSADQQSNQGIYVLRANLQPGDLIFFGSSGKATHVGIYSGNDMMIHNSTSAGYVVEVNLTTYINYTKNYYTARRII